MNARILALFWQLIEVPLSQSMAHKVINSITKLSPMYFENSVSMLTIWFTLYVFTFLIFVVIAVLVILYEIWFTLLLLLFFFSNQKATKRMNFAFMGRFMGALAILFFVNFVHKNSNPTLPVYTPWVEKLIISMDFYQYERCMQKNVTGDAFLRINADDVIAVSKQKEGFSFSLQSCPL